MKVLVQEFEELKNELDEIVLLRKRALIGISDEGEKANQAKKEAGILRQQMSVGAAQEPVDAILAGENPDYNIFDKVRVLAEEQEELSRVHEKTRRALLDKAGDLHTKKEYMEVKIQNCRHEIIKKAGLDLICKTDKQLVFNLLLAVGAWAGQPMIRSLENVPGVLSGQNWRVVHGAAVKDLLEKSGATIAL